MGSGRVVRSEAPPERAGGAAIAEILSRDDDRAARSSDAVPRAASDMRAGYLAHVDGLRAIAIGAVVIYHAWPRLLPGGYVGVDVFFVISGFLITRLIHAEMQAGTFDMLTFLARRARRLLPAAAVCFTLVMVLGGLVLLPETYRDLGRSLMGAALMYANVQFYRTAGYFSTPPEEKPLLHAWSLSVEDQFYLTWPLLLMVLVPLLRTRGRLMMATALLGAVSLWHAEATVTRHPDFAFYILTTRAWELLAGCLLAIAGPLAALPRSMALPAGAVGLALIAGSAVLLEPSIPFPGLSAVPVVVGTALAIMAGLGSPNPFTRLLAAPPMLFVGLVSYSLYLWHWPLLSLATSLAGRPLAAAEAGAAVALSFVLAVLSWRYVERPFRRHGAMSRQLLWRTLAASAATMAALALVGGGVKVLDGLPQRFDGAVGRMFTDMSSGNPLRRRCDGHELAFQNDGVCNFGKAKDAATSYDVAIFGDSNADHFVPMLASWVKAHGLSARQVTQSSCAALIGFDRAGRPPGQASDCRAYHEVLLRFLDANPRLRLVVLGGAWDGYAGRLSPTRSGSAAPATTDLRGALASVVALLRRRGVQVHILGQIPRFEVMPAICVARALQAGADPAACGLPAAEVRARHDPINAVIAAVAAADPGVTASYPDEVMCGAAWCSPIKDGVFLYRDPGHLSEAGARLIGKYLTFPALP